MKIKGGKIVYKMSELNKMLSEEEIEKMSKDYGFSKEDEYFHFDKEENFLESLNAEDIAYFNEGVEDSERLLVA